MSAEIVPARTTVDGCLAYVRDGWMACTPMQAIYAGSLRKHPTQATEGVLHRVPKAACLGCRMLPAQAVAGCQHRRPKNACEGHKKLPTQAVEGSLWYPSRIAFNMHRKPPLTTILGSFLLVPLL